jgi:hypothetical protein
MKNPEPEMITLPINAAHLMSLSGMLGQFASKPIHDIFSMQVALQAKMQGVDVFELEHSDYELLLGKTLNFSIPAKCVADVGNILMDAAKDEANEGLQVALNFLIQEWVPFAKAAVAAIEDCQIQPFHHNRFRNQGPESLN